MNSLHQIRNIGIIAHINAGKTTTTESILYHTGKEKRFGSVEEGTTVTDFLEEEVERGISILSALVTCVWKGVTLNIVDTPGHIDFTGEVEKTLRIIDAGLAIFSAVEGVQAQTELIWRQADQYHLPRLAFINKMDRVGADLNAVLQAILENFSIQPIALQLPIFKADQLLGCVDLVQMKWMNWGEHSTRNEKGGEIPEEFLIEAELAREAMFDLISETVHSEETDILLNAYLEGKDVSETLFFSVLREGVRRRTVLPVYCGVALKNQGISSLLDGIVSLLPSPLSACSEIKGIHPETRREVIWGGEKESPFCGLIFKLVFDKKRGWISFMRVYSGTFLPQEQVWNATLSCRETIGQILRVYGAEYEEGVKEASAGEIVGITGLQYSRTGDTLCREEAPILLVQKAFPLPVLSRAIEPKSDQDRETLMVLLKQLEKEDPTFQSKISEETGQCLIAGMGELHLEVLLQKLSRISPFVVNVGNPRILYKESIAFEVEKEVQIHKEVDGIFHYGHVRLKVVPMDEEEGVRIFYALTEEEKMYEKAIREGLETTIRGGGCYGYPLTQLGVQILEVEKHPENSELGIQMAARFALFHALREVAPVHFEPLMRCEIFFPGNFQGGVLGELQQRRAKILSMEALMFGTRIVAEVFLKEMFGYASRLRTITQGRGAFYMELTRYQKTELPAQERY